MSTLILGPYFLKTKGGYTTGIAYYPGFMSTDNNFGIYSRALTSTPIMASFSDTYLMSTICTSSAATPVGTPNKVLVGGPTGTTHLMIFRGSRPNVSTFTDLTAHSSNLLIDFSIPSYTNGGFRFTNGITPTASPKISASVTYSGVSMIAGICKTPTLATQSGTPSWFWFGNYTNGADVSDQSFVLGSISNSASDTTGDLVFYGDVVGGNSYISTGFKLDIPTFHTV